MQNTNLEESKLNLTQLEHSQTRKEKGDSMDTSQGTLRRVLWKCSVSALVDNCFVLWETAWLAIKESLCFRVLCSLTVRTLGIYKTWKYLHMEDVPHVPKLSAPSMELRSRTWHSLPNQVRKVRCKWHLNSRSHSRILILFQHNPYFFDSVTLICGVSNHVAELPF